MYRSSYDMTRPWAEVMEDLADDDVHAECYESSNGLVNYVHRRRMELIYSAVASEPGSRILEVGCGDGFVLERLSSLPSRQITGIELSTKRIARARRRAPGCEVVHGDAKQLPFPDGAFDITVCTEVLEHIPGPEAAADEMKRVTRPGGLIVVTVPNERNWRIGRALLLRFPIRIPDHVNAFTRRSMSAMFGMQPERMASVPPFGMQLCLTQVFSYRVK